MYIYGWNVFYDTHNVGGRCELYSLVYRVGIWTSDEWNQFPLTPVLIE